MTTQFSGVHPDKHRLRWNTPKALNQHRTCVASIEVNKVRYSPDTLWDCGELEDASFLCADSARVSALLMTYGLPKKCCTRLPVFD